jgi:hypothetical protein
VGLGALPLKLSWSELRRVAMDCGDSVYEIVPVTLCIESDRVIMLKN